MLTDDDPTRDDIDDIGGLVVERIRELLVEMDEDDVPTVEPTSTIRDLGMDSLMLARLVLELDDELGVEPFRSEEASVADVRTVDDMVRVYEQATRRRAAPQSA